MEKKKESNAAKYLYIASLAFVVVLIVSAIVFAYNTDIARYDAIDIRGISIDITAIILCGILIFSLANDKPWDGQNRALFRLMITLSILLYLDYMSIILEGHGTLATANKIVCTLLFYCETLLQYCFWRYIRKELHVDKQTKIADILCKAILVIDLVLDILNLKYGFFFTINANAEYIESKYVNYAEITSFVIYLTAWVIILRAGKTPIKERLSLLTFLIFPATVELVGVVANDAALVYPTYMFSAMIIFINVFSKRSKKILEQKVLLDKQRATLMVSQIQPHFLYNVLTTISNLCVTDPEEAEETTVLFSQYLRTNLDSLRKTEPVPFSVELGHINTYVTLEKKRFGDKLGIEMDTKELGFLVPALGLQPIVENSVKHGIRGKDTPGHLKISSRKLDSGFEVIIEDDGVGFDPNEPVKSDDGRSHVGMINVKSRLEQMCGATVKVESSPGNGCKTTIIFPEEDKL